MRKECIITVVAVWTLVCRGEVFRGEAPLSDPEFYPYVGNGFVATRVGAVELYVAGVFNGGDGSSGPTGLAPTVSHRANVKSPFALGFALTYTNEREWPRSRGMRRNREEERAGGELELRECALDTDRALVTRLFELDKLNVVHTIYAHAAYPSLLVQTIEAHNTGELDVILALRPPLQNSTDFSTISSSLSLENRTWLGQTLYAEVPNFPRPFVATCEYGPLEKLIPAGQRSTFSVLTTVGTSVGDSTESTNGNASLLQRTCGQLDELLVEGEMSLLQSHMKTWAARMETSTIRGTGNDTFVGEIQSSLYYLRASFRPKWPFGLSPGGLSTNAYNGHTFWDQDTWMAPIFAALGHDEARSLIQYRLSRLPAALHKAKRMGNNGIQYPWESGVTGVELTPQPNPEGDWEIHVSGDIVEFIRLYFYATDDMNWMKQFGFPVVSRVCEMWASRVTWNETLGEYTILNVQPPDESAGLVNNSAYTNVLASMNLLFCLEVGDVLGISIPDAEQWADIASNMYVPTRHIPTGEIHDEYDNYDGHIINQADVGLLQYPLNVPISRDIAYRDLLYWTQKTNPDGYYTGDSAYAIGWLQLGETQLAEVEFNKSFAHMEPPFNVWKEKVSGGNINFITGAGGFLQSVLFGYGGLRFRRTDIYVNPILPNVGLTSLEIRNVQYRDGVAFTLLISSKTVEVTQTRVSLTPLSVTFANTTHVFSRAGETLIFRRQPFTIQMENS